MYDDDVGDRAEEEEAVIGMWSAILWLIAMTLLVALLSDYLVSTIQVCLYISNIYNRKFTKLPSDKKARV